MKNRAHRTPRQLNKLCRERGFQLQTPEEHQDSGDIEPVAWLDNHNRILNAVATAKYDDFIAVHGDVVFVF